jgi:hypothetical protein
VALVGTHLGARMSPPRPLGALLDAELHLALHEEVEPWFITGEGENTICGVQEAAAAADPRYAEIAGNLGFREPSLVRELYCPARD